MKQQKTLIFLGILFLTSINSLCQQQVSLSDKLLNKKIKAINRVISLNKELPDAVEMNAKKGDGLGIIQDLEFDKGVIEIELMGENNPGKSFIGIAFNIQNEENYEAVYFRPFNFIAEEQIRKDHMVQYIFHPEFTWRKLRDERTGKFENEIVNPPNPDDWFKVIIHINDKKLKVYINEIHEPILIIDRLTLTKSNKIGIWTGNGSSGQFRNLILRKE